MPTIIDSFVVKLGLDGKAFAQDAEEAVKVVDRTKERTKKADKELTEAERREGKERAEIVRKEGAVREEAGRKVALGLSQLRNQALAVAAVFTAGMGLKNFISNTIASAAGLDRMSGTLGMSARDLSAWQLAAKNAGGSAEGIVAQLRESNQEAAKFKISGVTPGINRFLQFGGSAADLKDGNRYLLARADILKRLYDVDPSRAALIASEMGIGDDQFNFLRQGSGAVQAALARQAGPAGAMAAASGPAERLRKQFDNFQNTISSVSVRVLTALLPSFEKIVVKLQEMGDWFVKNKDRINDWVTGAVAGIEKFVEWADKAAKSVGGWQNVLLALAGLKILSIVSPLMSLAGALTSIATSLGAIGGAAGGAGIAALGSLGVVAGGVALAAYSASTNEGEAETITAMNTPLGNSNEIAAMVGRFQARGWSKEAAIGIVANLKKESSTFDPKDVGDKGTAFGIAQWRKERVDNFKRLYGINIQDATREQQETYVDWELRNSHKRAGDMLRGKVSPQQAAKIVSEFYEIPAKKEQEKLERAGIAGAIYSDIYRRENGGAGPISMDNILKNAGPSGRPASILSGGNTSSSETTIGQIIVQTQATDAQGIARGIGGALSENPIVSQSNNGLN